MRHAFPEANPDFITRQRLFRRHCLTLGGGWGFRDMYSTYRKLEGYVSAVTNVSFPSKHRYLFVGQLHNPNSELGTMRVFLGSGLMALSGQPPAAIGDKTDEISRNTFLMEINDPFAKLKRRSNREHFERDAR